LLFIKIFEKINFFLNHPKFLRSCHLKDAKYKMQYLTKCVSVKALSGIEFSSN
jgi:hypothetical protein